MKHGFIPMTAIFGNLECDWLTNADESGSGEGCLK